MIFGRPLDFGTFFFSSTVCVTGVMFAVGALLPKRLRILREPITAFVVFLTMALGVGFWK